GRAQREDLWRRPRVSARTPRRAARAAYHLIEHERPLLPQRGPADDPRPRAQDCARADRATRRPLRRDGDLSGRVDPRPHGRRPLRDLAVGGIRRDGYGVPALALVCEEIAWACAATATQYLDQPLGGLPILLAGTEEQKKKYLPRLATGEMLAAYSLSESGAGSDAAGLRTTAVRKGDRYVLNGSKQWCTNGDHADVIVVFATVDPKLRAKGVTAFLVERGMPGFAVGKTAMDVGIRA